MSHDVEEEEQHRRKDLAVREKQGGQRIIRMIREALLASLNPNSRVLKTVP